MRARKRKDGHYLATGRVEEATPCSVLPAEECPDLAILGIVTGLVPICFCPHAALVVDRELVLKYNRVPKLRSTPKNNVSEKPPDSQRDLLTIETMRFASICSDQVVSSGSKYSQR